MPHQKCNNPAVTVAGRAASQSFPISAHLYKHDHNHAASAMDNKFALHVNFHSQQVLDYTFKGSAGQTGIQHSSHLATCFQSKSRAKWRLQPNPTKHRGPWNLPKLQLNTSEPWTWVSGFRALAISEKKMLQSPKCWRFRRRGSAFSWIAAPRVLHSLPWCESHLLQRGISDFHVKIK